MTLSLAETVQLTRAAEQCAQVGACHGWERDSWNVRRDHKPEPPPRREACVECGRRTCRGTPWCQRHWARVQRTGTVEAHDDYPSKRELRRKGI